MSAIRKLLESFGLVREEKDSESRYAEADAVIADAHTAADEARRARLRDEDRSYRRPAGSR